MALDCILIGYHQMDVNQLFQKAKALKSASGAYDYYLYTTIPNGTKRCSYEELLDLIFKYIRPGQDSMPLRPYGKPSVGTAYIASFLRNKNISVQIINLFGREQDRFTDLLRENPRAIVLMSLYSNIQELIELTGLIKKQAPGIPIITGGPEIYKLCATKDRYFLDFIFKQIGADFYIYERQGEQTLAQLLKALKGGSSFTSIPNLIISHNGNYARTDLYRENNSLDVNLIDWRLFDRQDYAPVAEMRINRGCQFNCAFCSFTSLKQAFNYKKLDTIEREMDFFHEAGVKYIKFADDTFNTPLERFKNICRLMIRKSYNFTWMSFIRASNLDNEAFDLMAESGCAGVHMGLESSDQGILNNMNKRATISSYVKALQNFNQRDIMTRASFIVGFPGETNETAEKTMAFIQENAPTFYVPYIYHHEPISPIEKRRADFGLKNKFFSWTHDTMDWRTASHWCRNMISDIDRSIYNAQLTYFDYIDYLAAGITTDQIKQFAEAAQNIIVEGFDETPIDIAPHLSRMAKIFQSNQ